VVPRSEISDNAPRAEDLANYKLVEPGEIVINRMSAYQGALGIARQKGIVSPEYLVLRVSEAEPRFLAYLFKSTWFVSEMASRVRGIGSLEQGNVRTPRINPEDLGRIPVPIPPRTEQGTIADFLDAETARIDALIVKKQRVLKLLSQRRLSLAHNLLKGTNVLGPRRPSGIPWIGDIPATWDTSAVGHRFDVQLGRMLNQERAQGDHLRPYLRNLNVGWGRLHIGDVALMDFPPSERSRYLLQAGDLLVCEGGAGVAEAAVWNGEIDECYYQKSLHRVRPRGAWPVEWLSEWLRVWKAVGAHEAEGNLATIPHLTAEQFRAHRVPMPEPRMCRKLLRDLHVQETRMNRVATTVTRQLALITEHRQALITAAVTGQLKIPGVAA
jgi:type I restriction enzyme S subunit